MTDRERGTREADWIDTTAGDQDKRSGEAEGTSSLGAPPTDVARGEAPDADSESDAAGIGQSDLGGIDVGGGAKPGAGLGETRGEGFGTGTGVA